MSRKIRNKAICSFFKTLYYILRRRLHFPKERNTELVWASNGKKYVIFRGLTVDPKKNQPEKPGVILRIQFDFKNGSARTNKRMSKISIPFFAGLPGFRSKYWMIHEPSGGFQGVYEWDSVQDAENYKKSFAIKLITRRAVPGSMNFEIARINEF
ncbi:MAG: YdhR family protein [Candidatus Hodarchaeota archaeon]